MPRPTRHAPPGQPPTKSGRLTLMYVAALSTVALLTIGAQFLIQRQLDTGESDSRVINIAGRQRMLSQRIAKAALQLATGPESTEQASRRELAEATDEWSLSHRGLQFGDDARGLPGHASRDIVELFASIEPHYQVIREAAEKLAAGVVPEKRSEAVTAIQQNESAFLSGMDRVVSQYVQEAEARVNRLRRLELAILATTLAVLLVEGRFVFRPAIRQIVDTVARLDAVRRRLTSAKEEAERANAAKTRFLANVSHELRTPMTAVLGMTELARTTSDRAKRDHFLSIVEEAGESLLGLLDDLIDMSRIDADRVEIAAAPFDPVETVLRVEAMMNPGAVERGVRLTSDTARCGARRVLGDQRRVQQVLLNLVGNALKWTERGEVTIACESVPADDRRADLRFRVSDTGVGISEADRGRVFTAFARGEHPTATGRDGIGLGLAISRRLAEAMGGGLDLQSELGRGTIVTLTLRTPLAESAPLADDDRPHEHGDAQLRVLVVEDTGVNQVFLETTFRDAGHQALVVANGESALLALADFRPDVVVTDWRLPGIDGGQTALAIRQQSRSAGRRRPLLVCLTADATSRPTDAGALFDVWLTKPIGSKQLLTTVASARTRFVEGGDWKEGDAAPSDTTPQHAKPEPPSIDDSLRAELAIEFRRIAPQQIEQLTQAAERKDFDEIALHSHRLAGQVGYFDSQGLADELKHLERSARRRRSAAAEQALLLAARVDDLHEKLTAETCPEQPAANAVSDSAG